jgi:adenylosuccinate synthase
MTHAILVIDLAFGDCGKGTVADFLTRRHAAHTVVRFNGGPQAAHNVVTPDGRHHTFAQFGSGTFVRGVRTLLSRFMLIEPYALFNEARHLDKVGVPDALDRLTIDARCTVITPCHQAANRLRELARGDGAHGTCGVGVGETMQDLLAAPAMAVRAGDMADRVLVRQRLIELCRRKSDELSDTIERLAKVPAAQENIRTLRSPAWIDTAVEVYAQLARRARVAGPDAVHRLLGEAGTVVFEGAQGVLLDEWYGFHPHTTWSTTTFGNAETLLSEAGHTGTTTRVGVLRSYFTRHGAGPFVTADDSVRAALPEAHNRDVGWQGRFRVGPFDAVAARYAIDVAGRPDWLAITHLDRAAAVPPKIAVAYDGAELVHKHERDLIRQEQITRAITACKPIYRELSDNSADCFVQAIEDDLQCPARLLSFGPSADSKRLLPP